MATMANRDDITFPTEGWVYNKNVQERGKIQGIKDCS